LYCAGGGEKYKKMSEITQRYHKLYFI
jgi:hypothetical protein